MQAAENMHMAWSDVFFTPIAYVLIRSFRKKASSSLPFTCFEQPALFILQPLERGLFAFKGGNMHITFNGKILEVDENTTILQVLAQQNLNADKVVVERNENIVPAQDFASTILEAEDILEVLHFVGGG